MGEDFDDLAIAILSTEPAPAPAATPTPASPQPPEATPPVTATPPAPAPAAPPVAAQPPVPAAPAAPQSGETQPPDAVEAVLSEMQTKEKEIFEKILPAFALTPELVAEMEADAVATVPKLLASTFMKAVATSLRYNQQIVPQMISRAIAQKAASDEIERSFFSQFKDLDRAKHGKDIVAFAQTFKTQNPQITREELFSKVGAAVMAIHGIVPSASAAAQIAQQPGVVSVTPVPPQQPTAFVPASTGGTVMPPQSPVVTGFEGMGGDYD